MSMFDRFRTQSAVSRLAEEALYAEAMREIETGIRRDGIWARALAEANMDQSKAAATYIKLRVQSLKDEMSLAAPLAAMQQQEAERIAQEHIDLAAKKLDEQKDAARELARKNWLSRLAQEPPEDPIHPNCGGVIDRQETGRRVEWICRKCKKTGKFFLG